MSTINATININSDIGQGANISKTMTMHKLQSVVGIENTTGLASKTFRTTTIAKLFDAANADTGATAGKASKIYIRNTGSSKVNFFYVAYANAAAAAASTEVIGKLYGGDWMLIPWNATAATSHDVHVGASTENTMTLEYMAFVE